MMGALVAVLLIVIVGGRTIDGLRRSEAENILARLPQADALAYYDALRRRMRRIVLMRALALGSLLAIFWSFRRRLVEHGGGRAPSRPPAPRPPAPG